MMSTIVHAKESAVGDDDLSITETADVWDGVADTPEEAANLRVRADLIDAINARITQLGWSQHVAAQQLGVTQPRISDLRTGKIDRFSLDALVTLGAPIGVRVIVDEPSGN